MIKSDDYSSKSFNATIARHIRLHFPMAERTNNDSNIYKIWAHKKSF